VDTDSRNEDWLTEQFEASRPRLRAVAYRMLGSHAEADDAVQDTWIRVSRADANSVENLSGWMRTITARICLDRLRSRRARREDSAGSQPPEPRVVVEVAHDPEQQAVLAEAVGSALLLVLDVLAPAERVAFVLHDVFAVPFDEIGAILDRSPDAARQLASRARRRVQGTEGAPDVDLVRHRELVEAFVAAARQGNFEVLIALLDPDAVFRPDVGAQRLDDRRPAAGAANVARALAPGLQAARPALVNGMAGLAWASPTGTVRGAVSFTVVDDRISAIDVITVPDRVASLDVVLLDA
jgi:RNA polymerase sigma-70 factor (ECF subfamily)